MGGGENLSKIPLTPAPAGSISGPDLRLMPARWMAESRLARAGLATTAVIVVGAAAGRGPVVGAVAVAAVALVLLVVHRPLFGVLVMVAAVPITSGLTRGMPVPGFRVSELLTALIAGTILLSVPRERTRPWAIFDFAALAYAVATLVFGAADLAVRHAAVSFEDVGTLLGAFQFLLIYRATLVVIRQGRERLLCLYVLVAASIPVAALGILEQLNVGPFRAVAQSLTDVDLSAAGYQELGRATGTFDHWQALGGYLFLVILLGVALLGERPATRLRLLIVCALALDVSALVLSTTIAPAVCTLLGAAAISLWASRHRGWARLRPLLAIALAVLVAVVIFLPVIDQRVALQFGNGQATGQSSEVPQSLAYRSAVWQQQYFPAIQKHWLTGYGPKLPPEIHWQYTESLYFTLLLRGGIVLLLTFVALMVAAFVRALTAARDVDRGARVAGRVVLVAVLALIPMDAEIPYFVNAGLPHVFWLLIAIAGSRMLDGRRRPDSGGRLVGEV